jgi:thioredoxin reductase (NADPH)
MHRRDELRAGAILQNRAFENPKMDFVWDTVVTEIASQEGNGIVSHVETMNKKTGEKSNFETDGVFIFIGHLPNSSMFKGQVEMDDAGYIKTNMYMETSVPGVFAAGEIADPHFRQVITSAGMGAAAAIQATHFLEENS